MDWRHASPIPKPIGGSATSQRHFHRPTDPKPAAIHPLEGFGTGSVLVLDRVSAGGLHRARISRWERASSGPGLPVTAADNLHHDADRTSMCVPSLDRFFAAEALAYLPVPRSAPAVSPVP